MKTKKVVISPRIPETLHKKLQKESEHSGINQNKIVEVALSYILKNFPARYFEQRDEK